MIPPIHRCDLYGGRGRDWMQSDFSVIIPFIASNVSPSVLTRGGLFFFLFWVCIHNRTWLESFLINPVAAALSSHWCVNNRHSEKRQLPIKSFHAGTFWTRGAVITLLMEFLNSIYGSNFLRSPAARCFSRLFFIKMPSTPLSLLHLQPETRAANTINHLAERRQLDQLGCTKRGGLKTDFCEAERQESPAEKPGGESTVMKHWRKKRLRAELAGGFSSFNHLSKYNKCSQTCYMHKMHMHKSNRLGLRWFGKGKKKPQDIGHTEFKRFFFFKIKAIFLTLTNEH